MEGLENNVDVKKNEKSVSQRCVEKAKAYSPSSAFLKAFNQREKAHMIFIRFIILKPTARGRASSL